MVHMGSHLGGEPEPESESLAAFAAGLRQLHVRAGRPSLRRIARAAGFPARSFRASMRGGQLPPLDVTLALVESCGGDLAAWGQRWREASEASAPGEEPLPDHEHAAPSRLRAAASHAVVGGWRGRARWTAGTLGVIVALAAIPTAILLSAAGGHNAPPRSGSNAVPPPTSPVAAPRPGARSRVTPGHGPSSGTRVTPGHGPSSGHASGKRPGPTGVTATAGNARSTVSWTPPAFLNGASVNGYTATASPGGETCTTNGTTSCTITSLVNGTSYSITVIAHTTAGDSEASSPVTVVPISPPEPTVDQSVAITGNGTVTTATFDTTVAGETLLAFVSSDGPAGFGQQTVIVTGAGLTWTLIKRANAQFGDAEIWQATAPSVLTGATVTSEQTASGYDQDLTVVAIKNTGGVGAASAAWAASGAPTLSLTTTRAGSVIFAVGHDWDSARARALPAGWTLLNLWLDTRYADTYWSQYTSAPIAQAGTAVSVGDTAPVSDRWNLAAVEVTSDIG